MTRRAVRCHCPVWVRLRGPRQQLTQQASSFLQVNLCHHLGKYAFAVSPAFMDASAACPAAGSYVMCPFR